MTDEPAVTGAAKGDDSVVDNSVIDNSVACPCGFGSVYGDCCGPIHEGALASTAERLMRSRYSAFALASVNPALTEYLVFSWHPDEAPFAAELVPDEDTAWIRLAIESVDAGGPFDDQGFVTFTAVARTPEGRFLQRERSRFVRIGAERRWVYVDGVALEP